MKRAKQFYTAIIILCLIIIALSTYYTLGGFDSLTVFALPAKERTIIGKEYKEKYDASTFDKRMKETKAAIDSGTFEGKLTVVFYEKEGMSKDSLHYFLGASKDEISNVIKLPAGYEYKEFKTDQVFKIFITQHWLVRPLPKKIKALMEARAEEEGKTLQPYSFDIYFSDGSLSTERWAK